MRKEFTATDRREWAREMAMRAFPYFADTMGARSEEQTQAMKLALQTFIELGVVKGLLEHDLDSSAPFWTEEDADQIQGWWTKSVGDKLRAMRKSMPITINDCKFCGETPILFTGDTYFAYCPKCRYHIEGVTRDDAVREWNDLNKEEEQCQ